MPGLLQEAVQQWVEADERGHGGIDAARRLTQFRPHRCMTDSLPTPSRESVAFREIPPRPVREIAGEAVADIDRATEQLRTWGVSVPDDSRLQQAREILTPRRHHWLSRSKAPRRRIGSGRARVGLRLRGNCGDSAAASRRRSTSRTGVVPGRATQPCRGATGGPTAAAESVRCTCRLCAGGPFADPPRPLTSTRPEQPRSRA